MDLDRQVIAPAADPRRPAFAQNLHYISTALPHLTSLQARLHLYGELDDRLFTTRVVSSLANFLLQLIPGYTHHVYIFFHHFQMTVSGYTTRCLNRRKISACLAVVRIRSVYHHYRGLAAPPLYKLGET